MQGSLNEILAEPISKENEEILLKHLKAKMTSAARVAVRLLHAMEKHFGPEARDVIKEMIADLKSEPRPDAGDPEADLQQFCQNMERGCAGSHRWERIINEPDRIGYHFTRCMWAEIFRELSEPELGRLMCAGDKPAVKSWNPKLDFKRTKMLSRGDQMCDHIFYVRK